MAVNTHQQAALMDASMGADGQILVSFELGYPSDYAGEGAVWQAENESDSFFHLPKVTAQHKCQAHPQYSDFIRHKEAGVAIWCN